ncbi:MAG TPA: hypothetical protein VI731_12065, partial [Bacteroidia bacterium]|nr:hypothetical protein [Bacteroidia bacterium]
MKKLLVIFCLIFSGFLGGQNADKWEQIYGGPGPDIGYSVKTCPDSGYIVAGSYSSAGISDGYIIRTDDLGLIVWSK